MMYLLFFSLMRLYYIFSFSSFRSTQPFIMGKVAQLLYLDVKARGEIIRLLYKHANVPFEDKRLPFSELATAPQNRKYNTFNLFKISTHKSSQKK